MKAKIITKYVNCTHEFEFEFDGNDPSFKTLAKYVAALDHDTEWRLSLRKFLQENGLTKENYADKKKELPLQDVYFLVNWKEYRPS